MVIEPTDLPGVMVVESEPTLDERGSFARTFDAAIFAARGLDLRIVQSSSSFNARIGTLRGLHYQAVPHGETKLVRCTRGRIFDVVVDLRADSPTHCEWVGMELSADGTRSLFIPEGCAHGFQTLEDGSELHYQIGASYVAAASYGVRWDDPAFAIRWPRPPARGRTLSERDRAFPDYRV
jgi:dTDP-4-dehydrorhamnose 3,5-epimerase